MKRIPKHDWHQLAVKPQTSPLTIQVRQVTGRFRNNKWHLMKDQWWEAYLTDEEFDKFRQVKYTPVWKFVGE